MSIWGYIIGHTSRSQSSLLLFGGLTIGATAVLGSIFSSMTAAPQTDQARRRQLEQMPYDSQRTAVAQEQRLSSMIKDMVNGQGDQHWQAAMRGTLIPHPLQENKTVGIDNERAAKSTAK
ncbi:hypothetical protein CEUSTIGMA_g12364.t1 [Chlamydomonas eustigma]|uniref:Uncharacterized protein n=1 Tax=Chlamydomonas eustigma TaxID=1157962 RepID=A0A250XPL3_9CHLO|nr:hypothetical protein CEUSTIGMA_g12364.t1 [Chlamydomonas eustigma]|eukprot:GAX84943.1 hypothetical protein CEUSTIGMA_g12364.t1 [Chlamydomonas eustigma]